MSCCARAVVVSARPGFPATAGPAGRSIVERTVVIILALSTLAILDMTWIDNDCVSVGCDGELQNIQGVRV